MGLVEVGVGLIPGWGGCKEMLRRWRAQPEARRSGPMPPVAKAFETISTAKVAKSAAEAQRPAVPAPDRRHHHEPRPPAGRRQGARRWRWSRATQPPEPAELRLPGPTGRAALDHGGATASHAQGKATPHDVVVCRRLAEVLTGGDTDHTEDARPRTSCWRWSARAFMALLRDRRRPSPGSSTCSTPASRCGTERRLRDAHADLQGPAARHALRAQRVFADRRSLPTCPATRSSRPT